MKTSNNNCSHFRESGVFKQLSWKNLW